MRTVLGVLLLVVLHPLHALASERVHVADALQSVVPARHRLQQLCGADGSYEGCTRFVAYRLSASCVPSNDTWRMTATATFRPWIVLLNVRTLEHEKLHIEDVTQAVDAHVGALAGLVFADEPACRTRALIETASFEQKLRGFARDSNLARHAFLGR